MLHRAARAALRGFGLVEPNPMVGCVIASPEGAILATGHHRVFGAAHAEVEALHACARQGLSPSGATAWVTLEPCAHQGKQPPCTHALIAAGIARVVIARRDPNPIASGGADLLRSAGVKVEFSNASPLARAVSDPFVTRIRSSRPWIIAKWAQTIDGKIADAAGRSKWISCDASRRRVHALRGRVDAIVTGIGTLRADDARLTARAAPPRRTARRVVIDPRLETPLDAAVLEDLPRDPLTLYAAPMQREAHARAAALRARGVEIIEIEPDETGLPMLRIVRDLYTRHAAATVLLEAGPRLLGRCIEQDLIDQAIVFAAPRVLGDSNAPSAARLGDAIPIDHARVWELDRLHSAGADAQMWFRTRHDID